MRSTSLRLGMLLGVWGALLAVPAGASALEKLDDVSCVPSSFCLAVGASDAEGSSQAQARKWDGTKWSDLEVPVPDGASQSKLVSVQCWSTTLCAAVGDYADEEDETTLALVMDWDGSDWDIKDLPRPEASLSTKLTDFACPAAATCVAVGSYVDSADVRKSLAMQWDGSTWSLQSVPIPGGAALSELESVSCTAAGDCVAVGSFVNSSEVTKTLALSWNGSTWSINSTPEPEGAELNQLYDISCQPSDACTAVGTYFNAGGEQKTLALRRNTSKEWSIQSTPNLSGALSNKLTAISCPSTTSCVATGIAELGSKDLPLALGWNGTTWTQQSIDSEALGASSVKLVALTCLSSTQCLAVGAVAYGRSAADRNLAFAWNGSAWLVFEAGEYERGWLRLDASQATRRLQGIACGAPLSCFAVGAAVSDSGDRRAQIGAWNGENWTVKAAANPGGATASKLAGVTCIWSTFCLAVGSYSDAEGDEVPMLQSWNGTSWSIQSVPAPEGAKAAELTTIDCAFSESCTAAGSYVNAEGTTRPLAMTWNGSAWSLATVPFPEGAAAAWLEGIACYSTTFCFAVGSKTDPFGHEEAFVVKQVGSTWTQLVMPKMEDNAANALNSISCPSVSVCVAVGVADDSQNGPGLLAVKWDGSKWVTTETPTLGDDEPSASGLTSVSCVAVSDCVAVGGRPASSTRPPVVLRFDGEDWSEEPPAEYASGASTISLQGVSCYKESSYKPKRCAVVGSASYGDFTAKNFALAYMGGVWLTPYFPVPGGGLRGISCPQAERCLAVGDSIEPGGDPARAWGLAEEGWESTPTASASGAFLSDVSCTTADACTAIGRQGDWPFKPLAERWDGKDWSTQSVPVPAGRSSNPEAVDCPTESLCVAVGFSWPEAGPGPEKALIHGWGGSSWATGTPSLPGPAVASFLHDISCPSSSFCMAIGSYTDSADVSYGLVLTWNGSGWTSSTITPASGYSGYLRGVDCTSPTACTAVGTYTHAATNARGSVAHRWNGSSWTGQVAPMPEGATSVSLRSVDCYSSTRCVAVGAATDPATQNPYVIGWTDGQWSLEPAPEIPGNSQTTLESISCFSAADCTAVGIAQFADGPRELLVVQTEGEDPEGDDLVAVAGGGRPKFSAAQKEAVAEILAEDPGLQAAIGTAEYEPLIGTWAEIDEETGDVVLVGAFVEVVLEEAESWSERNWPATEYELGANGYESGSFTEVGLDASAEEIGALQINLDLVFDESLNPIEGEAVEIIPLPDGGGEVELNPASLGEYDAAVAGY